MLSANREGFTPFFPIWMPLIYFTCLIALARTSGTMLNKVPRVDIFNLNNFPPSFLSISLECLLVEDILINKFY